MFRVPSKFKKFKYSGIVCATEILSFSVQNKFRGDRGLIDVYAMKLIYMRRIRCFNNYTSPIAPVLHNVMRTFGAICGSKT